MGCYRRQLMIGDKIAFPKGDRYIIYEIIWQKPWNPKDGFVIKFINQRGKEIEFHESNQVAYFYDRIGRRIKPMENKYNSYRRIVNGDVIYIDGEPHTVCDITCQSWDKMYGFDILFRDDKGEEIDYSEYSDKGYICDSTGLIKMPSFPEQLNPKAQAKLKTLMALAKEMDFIESIWQMEEYIDVPLLINEGEIKIK